MLKGVFPNVVIGYYLGQRLPENLRPALRGARNLEEIIATVTVSKLYRHLSGARSLEEAEKRLWEGYYSILEEMYSISYGEYKLIVEYILERHAIRRTRALIGAIERGIPPEERRRCMAVGFLKPEALKATTIEEVREYIPKKYREKTIYEMFVVYRKDVLSAKMSRNVKRMIERELGLKTLMLIIRARNSKEIAPEVEKIAEVDPYASVDLVRRVVEAETRKDALEELSEHPFYEYIRYIEDPFEAYFTLHERMPEIIGFKNVPIKPSPERLYSGLKALEREVEKLVSIMNMVVV